MHIAVDVREACRSQRTGKGQWTFAFVTELLRRPVTLSLILDDQQLPPQWLDEIQSRHETVYVRRFSSSGLLWHVQVARFIRKAQNIDIYLSPTSYLVPFLLGTSKRVVPIVHDLIAFRSEPHDAKATFIERFTLWRIVRCAAMIATVSDATAEDLNAKYPFLPASKVVPIYASAFDESTSRRSQLDRTILCIATLCPRKNQHRLIRAYALLPSEIRSQYSLVLVGARGWHDGEILQLISSTPGVEWMQYLPQDQCRKLLLDCTLFAYPSLYEGFGMPILEAMRLGVPVLTSNRGSMREVASEHAVLVNPESVEDLSTGLLHLLTNGVLRKRLSDEGKLHAMQYSWKRTVDLFLESAENVY